MLSVRATRMLASACVLAAIQMVAFTTVAGLTRPGYDPSRNWISQLSLGPGGWLADLNLALCGLWLVIGAAGLRWAGIRHSHTGSAVAGLSRSGRWAVGLVAWCGGCLVVLALVPTDAGIGYPPGVPATHTTVGLVHQMVAVVLGMAGIAAAALLGRVVRRPYAGTGVALLMTVTFVAASVLVVLDDTGVLPGSPSGLLERVALFTGLAWIAVVAVELTIRAGPSGSSERAPGRLSAAGTTDAATETARATNAR